MPLLRNCVIVTDNYGGRCLFGEVYEDSRFEEGHHILTSKIKSINEEQNIAITRTGTSYKVENLMTHHELIEHIDKTYADKEYKEYLKSFIK